MADADPAAASGEWAEFAQKVELTTRLRNILGDYPQGVGVLKEFLQNADDAGASSFSLLLDETSFPAAELPPDWAGLAPWMGPALYVYNDGVFSDGDFESLASIGNSGKVADAGKIGRYGLGFSTSYHLTDLVSFVSRSSLVVFDPHRAHLPGGSPGLRTDFTANAGAAAVARTFAQPCFGCDPAEAFDGTLFRLPLRDAAAAERSLISSTSCSPGDVLAMLAEFAHVADSFLLFLKNVAHVSVLVRAAGEAAPREVLSVRTTNASEQLRAERALMLDCLAGSSSDGLDGLGHGKSVTFEMAFEVRAAEDPRLPGAEAGEAVARRARWLVHNGLDGDEAALEEARALDADALPWGGVAMRLDGQEGGHCDGRAYCFLPLPLSTGLPVHVNAAFALSSNRRHLWGGADMAGQGAARARWNEMLLTSTLPKLYADLLEQCAQRRHGRSVQRLVDAWPAAGAAAPFDRLAAATLRELAARGSKVVWDPVDRRFRAIGEVVFKEPHFQETCGDALDRAMHKAGCKVVPMVERVVLSLQEAGLPVETTTLYLVAELLHTEAAAAAGVLTRESASDLLRFLLTWEPPAGDGPVTPAARIDELHGLRLVPLTDRRLGVLEAATRSAGDLLFLCPPAYRGLLPDFPHFVDHESHAYDLLADRAVYRHTNVRVFGAGALAGAMDHLYGRRMGACKVLRPSPAGDLYVPAGAGAGGGGGRAAAAGAAGAADEPAPEGRGQGQGQGRKPRRRAKTSKQRDKEPPTEPPTAASKHAVDGQTTLARIRLMWTMLEESDAAPPKLIRGKPIVPAQGREPLPWLVDFQTATSRCLLASQWSDAEREVLTQFGCLFIDDSGPQMRALLAALATRQSLWPALVPFAGHGGGDPAALRQLLLRVMDDFEPPVRVAGVLGSLPVFAVAGELRPLRAAQRAPTPVWAALLAQHEPSAVFDESHPDSKRLLVAAREQRPPLLGFLGAFVRRHPELAALPDELLLALVRSVGELPSSQSAWTGNGQDAQDLREALRQQRFVPLPDGSRARIDELPDPSDELVSQVTDVARRLPPAFADPPVLRVLRRAGMLSLRRFDTYRAAAAAARERGDFEACQRLAYFLSRAAGGDKLGWSSRDMARLGGMHVAPAYDLTALGAAEVAGGAWAVEEHQTLVAYSGAVLSQDRLVAWTQLPVLAGEVDGACGHKVLDRLRVQNPVPLDVVVAHLREVVRMAGGVCSAEYDQVARRVAQRLSALVGKASARDLDERLGALPWVPTLDNTLAAPRDMCLDLDVDLSETARAVPEGFHKFHKLLVALGAKTTAGSGAEAVRVSRRNPHNQLLRFVADACNDPAMSDTELHCGDGEVLFANRLVLCCGSEVFRAMFSGELAPSAALAVDADADSSAAAAARTVVRLAAPLDGAAVLLALQYLYTGELPPAEYSQETVDSRLRLLLVADAFLLEHLKQLCEQFLADTRVVSAANVVDLLEHAHNCNARRLFAFCAQNIRHVASVITQTEEWAALPEEVKRRVVE